MSGDPIFGRERLAYNSYYQKIANTEIVNISDDLEFAIPNNWEIVRLTVFTTFALAVSYPW